MKPKSPLLGIYTSEVVWFSFSGIAAAIFWHPLALVLTIVILVITLYFYTHIEASAEKVWREDQVRSHRYRRYRRRKFNAKRNHFGCK